MKAQPNRSKSGGFSAHYVISAGGSRAILAGCGSIFASQLAGVDWNSIGGVSGGSIPAILLAAGFSPAQLLKYALELDFREKCVATAGKLKTLLAVLLKEYHEHPQNRTGFGVMETDKLAEFIDELVPVWPEKFWTMAVDGTSQIVFKKDGIFRYDIDGTCTKLSDNPGKPGFAIQATCAIPGITKAPKLDGVHLYDGAYTHHGICPVGVPIERWGADPKTVIGVCVGEDMMDGIAGYLRRFWKWIWRIQPDNSWGPHAAGAIEIHPHIDHIHALRFDLSADEKWLAVLEGFAETVEAYAANGILKGEQLKTARAVLAALPDLSKAETPGLGYPQRLSCQAEKVFKEHGLL